MAKEPINERGKQTFLLHRAIRSGDTVKDVIVDIARAFPGALEKCEDKTGMFLFLIVAATDAELNTNIELTVMATDVISPLCKQAGGS